MVNRELVRRKLTKLIQYLEELETVKKYTLKNYLDNFFVQRTVERLIQLIVEVATDINGHILVDSGEGTAPDYYSSFIRLSQLGIFSREFAKNLAPSTGLRNRLVHEYEEIDDKIVYNSIDKVLDMYSKYINYIKEYLDKEIEREVEENKMESKNKNSTMIKSKVKVVIDANSELSEGPAWDEINQRLFWVDINGANVHIYDPYSDTNRAINVGKPVGAVVPWKDGQAMLALKDGFASLDLEREEVNYIVKVEEDIPSNRFNDGKCDPAGRFWAGTMSIESSQPVGNLYCLDTDLSVRKVLEGVTISNGLAWSPDWETMYYNDSPTGQVVAFDYDLETGTIKNKRTVVEIPEKDGVPDGMTIDTEGRLWVAQWGGYQISCWDPETGNLIEQIELPVAHVSSCCFGGENLDKLYITTAKAGLSKEEFKKQPEAGCVFAVKTEVKGGKTYRFKG